MSDHGEKTQAERDLERKERDRLLTNLYEATLKIDPQVEAIPSIKALRSLYDLGLKEAKDVHDGIMQITGRRPYNDTVRTWLVVPANSRRDAEDAEVEIRRLTEALVAANTRVAQFEDEREHCANKTCNVLLTDRERGFCSTYCFEQHRQRIVDEARVAEIDHQIKLLEGDIADLRTERDRIERDLNPEPDYTDEDDYRVTEYPDGRTLEDYPAPF